MPGENPSATAHSEQKIAQRLQVGLVAPLGVLLVGGVLFEKLKHGTTDAIYFVAYLIPVFVIAALVGRVLSRRSFMRLSQLRRGAERLEQGHFEILPSDGDEDEFTDLARAFNHMSKVIASRESTQRQQNMALADLNRRMETVLNATNDGIALLDRDGRFALVNRRFCEMLGARPENLLYQPVTEAQKLLTSKLAHPERLMGRLGSFTQADLTHPVGVTEEVIEVLGTERRFIQVYTAPVRDEHREVTGRILALHDITRETEVDKMKTEFISVVSHELRTPLTAIKGYTDLMLSGQTGDVTELQREFLGIIQGSANRLNNLINDILDISRLESGRIDIKMERVDFERIVHDVLRLMKASADEKQISLDASLPAYWPAVRGDADKITQVMANLLSNAIKYTPSGGWVKISMEVTGDASITTCVADSGVGISPEDQKKLFQKFFRADNSLTREAGGTGLGLAIVKTMIELLGGAVWVESEPGKGSRFYFTLPLYIDAKMVENIAIDRETEIDGLMAIAVRQPSEPTPESKPAVVLDRGLGLVLMIDDDIFVREHLEHSLHRLGYGVITVDNVADAMQRARVHRPDVILLDMMMRDMVGFQIQRALYEDPATTALPIIGYSMVGDPVHGSLSLGPFSFLRKPLNTQLLVKSLREHFGRGRELSVLSVSLLDSMDENETATIREQLLRAKISLIVAHDSGSAVAMAIQHRPAAILIDLNDKDAASDGLHELLKAFKSEEDMARIPLILVSGKIAENAMHFHLGGDAAELSVAFDYLSEQIARVLRDKSAAPVLARPVSAHESELIRRAEAA